MTNLAAGLTEIDWETYSKAAVDFEARGGNCQLAAKVYRLPDGNLGVAWAYRAPTAQELAGLRAALAELIAAIKSN